MLHRHAGPFDDFEHHGCVAGQLRRLREQQVSPASRSYRGGVTKPVAAVVPLPQQTTTRASSGADLPARRGRRSPSAPSRGRRTRRWRDGLRACSRVRGILSPLARRASRDTLAGALKLRFLAAAGAAPRTVRGPDGLHCDPPSTALQRISEDFGRNSRTRPLLFRCIPGLQSIRWLPSPTKARLQNAPARDVPRWRARASG